MSVGSIDIVAVPQVPTGNPAGGGGSGDTIPVDGGPDLILVDPGSAESSDSGSSSTPDGDMKEIGTLKGYDGATVYEDENGDIFIVFDDGSEHGRLMSAEEYARLEVDAMAGDQDAIDTLEELGATEDELALYAHVDDDAASGGEEAEQCATGAGGDGSVDGQDGDGGESADTEAKRADRGDKPDCQEEQCASGENEPGSAEDDDGGDTGGADQTNGDQQRWYEKNDPGEDDLGGVNGRQILHSDGDRDVVQFLDGQGNHLGYMDYEEFKELKAAADSGDKAAIDELRSLGITASNEGTFAYGQHASTTGQDGNAAPENGEGTERGPGGNGASDERGDGHGSGTVGGTDGGSSRDEVPVEGDTMISSSIVRNNNGTNNDDSDDDYTASVTLAYDTKAEAAEHGTPTQAADGRWEVTVTENFDTHGEASQWVDEEHHQGIYVEETDPGRSADQTTAWNAIERDNEPENPDNQQGNWKWAPPAADAGISVEDVDYDGDYVVSSSTQFNPETQRYETTTVTAFNSEAEAKAYAAASNDGRGEHDPNTLYRYNATTGRYEVLETRTFADEQEARNHANTVNAPFSAHDPNDPTSEMVTMEKEVSANNRRGYETIYEDVLPSEVDEYEADGWTRVEE